MQGLISELPEPYNKQVYDIWAEIAEECDLHKAPGTTPIPHFTWHVAQAYRTEVVDICQAFCSYMVPPPIITTGLGIFTGEHPVVFITIKPTPDLQLFHQKLFEVISPATVGSISLYEPETWSPHITLALGDTTPSTSGQIISCLSGRNFNWQFSVNSLVRVQDNVKTGVFDKAESFHFVSN